MTLGNNNLILPISSILFISNTLSCISFSRLATSTLSLWPMTKRSTSASRWSPTALSVWTGSVASAAYRSCSPSTWSSFRRLRQPIETCGATETRSRTMRSSSATGSRRRDSNGISAIWFLLHLFCFVPFFLSLLIQHLALFWLSNKTVVV